MHLKFVFKLARDSDRESFTLVAIIPASCRFMPLLRLLHLPLRRRRRRPRRLLLRMRLGPLVLRGRPLVLRGRPLVLLGGADRDGAVGLGHAAVVALAAAVAVVEVAGRLLVEAVVGAGAVAGRGPEDTTMN